MNKEKVLFLSPGPKYNLKHVFANRCEILSEAFYGTVLTAGPVGKREKYGSFDIQCIYERKPRSIKSTFAFLFCGFLLLRQAKKKGDPYKIFVTYDPLKTGLIAAILCKFFSTKLVVEVNGDYTDDVIYWDIENKVRRSFKKFMMITVERYVLKRSDGIKLLYDTQVDSFKPLPRFPVIKRFPDFVDADRFSCMGEEKVVLFAGFPFWIKGVDILIEAFKKVSEKHKDWTLKILGYYPDKEFMESFICGHPRIFHHDPVDPEEMPDHIGNCGIFVLPSRSEAMGRVLVESMAAGKPRIGSNVGGIPTVISDGVDGLLFSKGNADELADKLDMLMSDSDLRKRLGQSARRRYEDSFRPSSYFNSLTDFYKSCSKKA